MKRVLSGAVAVVLMVSSSVAGPEEDRSPRATEDPPSVEKRLGALEAKVRAHQETLDRLARMQGPYLFAAPDSQPWTAARPFSDSVPGTDNVYHGLVPDPATAANARRRFDRCLITVDGATFDPHFAVKLPELDSRMVVAPRVQGLPAGSWPYRPARP